MTLAGCPLEEKISEFQKLKTEGWPIGALAMICVDNPMVAATGHRICNDCMKSCIYQKQEPVNIPQAETRTLKDVLELPWGFEIYSLLTRWNPLNLRRPLPRAATGKRVLVVGHGAGRLHARASPDERRPHGRRHRRPEDRAARREARRRRRPTGARVPFEPIRDVDALLEPLDERVMAGFGGVAEYGITVRWDKNFLKMMRLLLERRAQFALFGGVRFGGTLDAEDAFALGFDHVALAVGAGRPTVLDMPNGLARGVRTASDFLMALQLTGAAKTRLDRQHAGAAAGRRDRRRPHRDRHGDRVARLLPGAGREIPARATRRWRASAAEAACATAGRTKSARSPTSSWTHARAIRAERAGRGREQRAPRILELLQALGRRHDRLSHAADRQPVVHAQPRGSREGARGRHPLRRGPDAARGRGRRRRPRPARSKVSHASATDVARRRARAAGAHDPGRRRHAAEHRARARGCRRTSRSTAHFRLSTRTASR